MGKIAYIRIEDSNSLSEKDLLQTMAAENIEKDNIFIDEVTDKSSKRSNFYAMLKALKPSDTVFVKDIGSLGIDYDDIILNWKTITQKKKADIVVLDTPMLDTRRGKEFVGSLITDTVLAVLSSVADNERKKKDVIHQKNAEAISAAKEKGIRFGAPEIPVPENFELAVDMWQSGEITIREAAKKCNMPKSTFYGKAKKYLNKNVIS